MAWIDLLFAFCAQVLVNWPLIATTLRLIQRNWAKMVAFWSCFGIFNALIPPLPSKCDNFGIFLDLSKFAIRLTRRQPAGLSPLGFMLSPGFWRPVAARGRCARGILVLEHDP